MHASQNKIEIRPDMQRLIGSAPPELGIVPAGNAIKILSTFKNVKLSCTRCSPMDTYIHIHTCVCVFAVNAFNESIFMEYIYTHIHMYIYICKYIYMCAFNHKISVGVRSSHEEKTHPANYVRAT